MKYKNPIPVVDIIISSEKGVVLIKRKRKPAKGKWAFPGGFINYGESAEEAAIRETKEETNLKVKIKKLFSVYSIPSRDPRGHLISIVYLAEIREGDLKPKDDASDIRFFKEIRAKDLAFDHAKILRNFKLIKVI